MPLEAVACVRAVGEALRSRAAPLVSRTVTRVAVVPGGDGRVCVRTRTDDVPLEAVACVRAVGEALRSRTAPVVSRTVMRVAVAPGGTTASAS